MSIDWITVAAQIANFLVLIWLLKRFLYRPILDGIDAREAEIAARMGEAEKVRRASEARAAEYEAEIGKLRASRADILAEAQRAAEAERAAMLTETREELTRVRAERETERAEEVERFTAELNREGAEAILALARKAVADLADESLERRIVAHAAAQLARRRDEIAAAAGDNPEAVALTRDPLPEDAQARLREALAPILPGARLRFQTDPALSPGLSLRVGGAQVGWTVADYFDGLEAMLEDRIGRTGRTGRARQTDAA